MQFSAKSKFLTVCHSAICLCTSIVLLMILALFFAVIFGTLMGPEFAMLGGGMIVAMAAIMKTI